MVTAIAGYEVPTKRPPGYIGIWDVVAYGDGDTWNWVVMIREAGEEPCQRTYEDTAARFG